MEVSLKEYVEKLVEASEKKADIRIAAMEKATTVAYANMEGRLTGMNEFRQTLSDQAGKFPTREELNAYLKSINDDLRMLRESKAQMDGKASQNSVMISLILGVMGLSIGVIGLVSRFFGN